MGTVLAPLQYRSYRSFITKGTLLEQRHAAHTPLHCAGQLKPPQLTIHSFQRHTRWLTQGFISRSGKVSAGLSLKWLVNDYYLVSWNTSKHLSKIKIASQELQEGLLTLDEANEDGQEDDEGDSGGHVGALVDTRTRLRSSDCEKKTSF